MDSYVALVPQVLRSGKREAVSLTLFQGDRLVRSRVRVSLAQEGREMAAGEGVVVLTNKNVPQGKEYGRDRGFFRVVPLP